MARSREDIRLEVQQAMDSADTIDKKAQILDKYFDTNNYFPALVAATSYNQALVKEGKVDDAALVAQNMDAMVDAWHMREENAKDFINAERDKFFKSTNDGIFWSIGKSEKDIAFVPQNSVVVFPPGDKATIGHCWLDPCISVTLQHKGEDQKPTGLRYAAHFDVKADREEIRAFAKELTSKGGSYDLLMVGGNSGGGTAPLQKDIEQIFDEEKVPVRNAVTKVGKKEHFNNFIVDENFKDIGIATPPVSDEAKKRFQMENLMFGQYDLKKGEGKELSALNAPRPLHVEVHGKEPLPKATYDPKMLHTCLRLTPEDIQLQYKNPIQAQQNIETVKHFNEAREQLGKITQGAMEKSQAVKVKKPSQEAQITMVGDTTHDLLGYAYAMETSQSKGNRKTKGNDVTTYLEDKAKETVATHPAIHDKAPQQQTVGRWK